MSIVWAFVALAAMAVPPQDGAPPPPPPQAGAGQSSPSVTQLHDVRSLIEIDSPGQIEFDLSPVPGVVIHSDFERTRFLINEGDLTDIVTRLLRGAGVTDDFKIETEETALSVVAPPSVQKEVDRILATLRAALIGEARLELRAIRLAPDAQLALLTNGATESTLIDQSEADRREQALTASRQGRVVRLGRARPLDGIAQSIEEVDTRRGIHEYKVEVGDGPIHYEPVVESDLEGLTACVCAARCDGATTLDLALRYAEPVAPMRALTVAPTLWYVEPRSETTGARMFHGKVPIRLDLPLHRFVSFAASFVVPDGKSLWIPCRITTKTGVSSLIVEVRVRGPVRPLVQRLSRDGDARQLALLHAASQNQHGFNAPDYSRRSFDLRWPRRPNRGDPSISQDDGFWPSIVVAKEAGDSPFDFTSMVQFRKFGDQQADAVVIETQNVLFDAPVDVDDAIHHDYAPALAPPAIFELHGTIRREGVAVAEFRLPTIAGRSATLWSGFEGAYLRTWDVNVANIQQVGVPIVSWYLDGFALTFVVTPIGPGRVQVTASGVVNLVDQPPARAELGPADTPFYELIKSRRLFVDGATAITGGESARAIRIGGSSIALEVTAVAR